jgi:hypothetical protein
MLLTEKLKMPFEKIPLSHKIWWKCDYCGKEFEREIKVINRACKNSPTHSCGSKECKAKKKEDGCMSKYGVSHVSKLPEVNAKRIIGIKAKMPQTLEKMKKTNLEKYGNEFASKTDFVKEKMKETCLNKYGSECSLQSDEIKEKSKRTNLEKFGVEFAIQSELVQEKRKQTNLERFGCEYASQSEEVKQKIIESNLANHGVPYSGMREDVKQKIVKTNIEKYGVSNPLKNEEINNNRKKTNIEKYGHECPFANQNVIEKIENTNIEKYGFPKASQNKQVIEKMIATNIEKYGVPAACMLSENRVYGKTQNEIGIWLNSFGFDFKTDRNILNGKEIDLLDINVKIGFEYCGLYWHNELSDPSRTRTYHYNKYKNCKDKGVRLITIFEDEWLHRNAQCKNFIKSILNKNEIKIFARKCQIKQIEKQEFQNFCENYHIQGKNHLAIICYGIFYNDELIGGMSFGKHHRNGAELTLDRLCFKDNITVIGGSSKLFSACVKWAKENSYDKVISWSDNRWSAGGVYEKLGFNLETDGKPDYSYVDLIKKNIRRSKQSQKKKEFSSKTERQICLEKGLARIWDCGKKKWVFNLT